MRAVCLQQLTHLVAVLPASANSKLLGGQLGVVDRPGALFGKSLIFNEVSRPTEVAQLRQCLGNIC